VAENNSVAIDINSNKEIRLPFAPTFINLQSVKPGRNLEGDRGRITQYANEKGVHVLFPLDIIEFHPKYTDVMKKVFAGYVIVVKENNNADQVANSMSNELGILTVCNGVSYNNGKMSGKVKLNININNFRNMDEIWNPYNT